MKTTKIQVSEKPILTKEEIKAWDAENHEKFYENTQAIEYEEPPAKSDKKCCGITFSNVWSFKRHVAFAHNPRKVAKGLNLEVLLLLHCHSVEISRFFFHSDFT